MSADDAITALAAASTDTEATRLLDTWPRSILLALADLLYIDHAPHARNSTLRRLIAAEARA